MEDVKTFTIVPGAIKTESNHAATEKPVFDFSEVGYRWQRDYMKVTMTAARASTLIDNPAREDITPTEKAALTLAKLNAVDEFEASIARRDELISQVIVSIPRHWLTKDAPGEIDWRDPDNLGYLRDIGQLLMALTEARQDSKN
jgi:hypothetical protein